jgi:flavin-dependent dehydrogenase
MIDIPQYDIAIVGGGLGGLTFALQAIEQGYSVALFEKETYPFHKVCGEYISLESWNFLTSLGVPLASLDLPIIKNLSVTDVLGNEYSFDLPLGGFGISRFFFRQLFVSIMY